MKRPVVTSLCVVALLFICWAIDWFSTVRSRGDFGLSKDENQAFRVLERVQHAEARCYKARGQYAPLEDLSPGGCGGIERSLSSGMEDGFTVELHVTSDKYSVRVSPVDTSKLFSLHSDQTGVLHYETRNRPPAIPSR